MNTERSPQRSPLRSRIVYSTSSAQAAGEETPSGFPASRDVHSLVQGLAGPGSQEEAVCPEKSGENREGPSLAAEACHRDRIDSAGLKGVI